MVLLKNKFFTKATWRSLVETIKRLCTFVVGSVVVLFLANVADRKLVPEGTQLDTLGSLLVLFVALGLLIGALISIYWVFKPIGRAIRDYIRGLRTRKRHMQPS